jgi:hypothetical protein
VGGGGPELEPGRTRAHKEGGLAASRPPYISSIEEQVVPRAGRDFEEFAREPEGAHRRVCERDSGERKAMLHASRCSRSLQGLRLKALRWDLRRG